MKKQSISLGLISLAFIALEIGGSASSLGLKAAKAIDISNNIKRAENSQVQVLKVYNSDDYILPDMDAREAENNGYDPEPIKGINTRFEEYMKNEYGKNVRVQYETFSTNEDMINQLRTGKIDFDLVCPSDYAIQRLMAQDLIIPFESNDYPGSTPNYDQYASPYLIEKVKSIKAVDCYNGGTSGEEKTDIMQNYMRGYMWGTVGLLYNPTFYKFQDRNITPEKITEDIKDWNIMWDEDYKNTAYAKDSVRDTMAAVYMNAFHDEIYALKDQFEAKTISDDEYNEKLTEIFNRTEQHYLDQQISNSLSTLSKNIYGYEVDNGKDDIQKGTMVGIDLAWSGDAVYAMNGADELRKADPSKPTLYYVLPEGCDNLWLDGWCMTKNALTHGVTELAQQYVDFLSNPFPESDEYEMGPAVANMDYIGYTPFIASDEILNYLRDSYDVRTPEENEEIIGDETSDGSSGNEEYNPYIDAPEGVEGEDYLKKDLSYFFEGTLEDNKDAYIYYDVESKDRQLDAMYPDASILPHLVIMKDYGDRTTAVNEVWEAGKALQFPAWGYWLVLSIVLAGLITWGVLELRKKSLNDKRKTRMAAIVLNMDESQTTEKQRKDAHKIIEKANKQNKDTTTKTDLPKQ